MKAFLKKYKGTIIYWLVLVFMIFYFAPQQNKFYLKNDIKYFRFHYFLPILIWTLGLIALGLFIYWLTITKSFLKSGTGFIQVILIFAFAAFIFQHIFLSVALFINRQVKIGVVQKTYRAQFMTETAFTKNNLILEDLTTKEITIFDPGLKNELYYDGLKQNDTVRLKLSKGLFGIAYKAEAFKEK